MSRAQRISTGYSNLLVAWEGWRRLPTTGGNAGVEWHTACGQKSGTVMCADHGVWEEGVAISPKEGQPFRLKI